MKQGLHRLLRPGTRGGDPDFGAHPSRQHHQPHDGTGWYALAITQHIDAAAWNAEQQAEQLEKATLADIQAYLVQEQNYG